MSVQHVAVTTGRETVVRDKPDDEDPMMATVLKIKLSSSVANTSERETCRSQNIDNQVIQISEQFQAHERNQSLRDNFFKI